MTTSTKLIEKFAPVLRGEHPPVVRDPRLLLDASGSVKIYYAPFEYINPSARIVFELPSVFRLPKDVVHATSFS